MPCRSLGANHSRLRHQGLEKCGHGLTSRPRETSHPGFLDSLLAVFGYSLGSGGLLLSGELPLRFCSGNFALRKPSWGLPDSGGVQDLLSESGPDFSVVEPPAAEGLARPVGCWTKGAGGLGRECDLPRKRMVRWFVGVVFPMFFMVFRWKRLRFHDEALGFGAHNDKWGRFSLDEQVSFPREGVG